MILMFIQNLQQAMVGGTVRHYGPPSTGGPRGACQTREGILNFIDIKLIIKS